MTPLLLMLTITFHKLVITPELVNSCPAKDVGCNCRRMDICK
jgi:hypothetical protein